ncbi:MAG: heavy metal translocating P-type ATPase [Clostridia bacterium]|nr:heavy metal translocating P-type ATPase [Clostridia bacterium]
MQKYDVIGMSCAACSTRVEKAVSSVEGVTSCSVNLLTNSMGVEGSATAEQIISAVRRAGYDAKLNGSQSIKVEASDSLEDTQTPKLRKRLLWSLVFLIVLMYISMGHIMLGFPVPAFFDGNQLALGLLEMLLTVAVMIINQKFFVSGFKGIINRAPNMDTLVALGSSAAFIYSTVELFRMTATNDNLLHGLYFESASMILALITVGKMLEARSKGKTTDALKSLMNLSPETATVERNGKETEIPVDEVITGDIFVVRSGQTIPVDGFIIDGGCSLDESSLTGESVPVDKSENDTVFAGTVNKSGFIRCKATRTGENTTLSHIIKMVSDASATKAPIAKIADRVSGVFVPVVIGISVLTAIIWFISGKNFGFVLARAISVLVISCPCALGLATPVAIMVGSGVGAKNGILFKTAVSLEQTGKARTVIFDKTGTVTEGKPVVTDIIPFGNTSENELLSVAYSLEYKSEHPLGNAIVVYAEKNQAEIKETTDFITHAGNGIEALIDGKPAFGGKSEFIKSKTDSDQDTAEQVEILSENGKTPLLFSYDGRLLGIIAVADAVKEESKQAVAELKNMGIDVVMLTGDNKKTARAIAGQAGIDNVVVGVLPDEKEKYVRDIHKNGKVIMVGDGINDSPALARADVGIAIGAGTDIAVEAADVVLMNSKLTDVSAAIRLSRAVYKNIKENLFWAFFYNAICIPVAAGVLIPHFGIELNPMLAAAAMSLSSFCVVSNALRLNLVDIRSPKRDKHKHFKEVKAMEKTVKIEGMMCPHCEARVKQVLEALPQVDEATPSHESGTAVIKLNADLADSEIKAVIEAQGYKVL